MKKLSNRELEIMEVLWKKKTPVSANDILTAIPDTTMNTIQPNLKKLLNKGFIQVTGVGYTKNSVTRLFSPLVKKFDYFSSFFDNSNFFEFTSSLVDETDDLEQIKYLEKLVQKKKEDLQNKK